MFQYSGKSLFSRVSEETKIFFFSAVVLAAFSFQQALPLLILFVSLSAILLLSGFRDFKKLLLSILPFLLLADIGFLLFLSDTSISLVQLTVSSNLRILCLFTATSFFTFSTDIFSLIRLMKRLRVPETIYLPAYILFRFLPEVERDLVEITAIQRLRGFSKKRPMLYIKSITLPLLFTSLQRADDLAIAYYLRKKRGGKG